MGWGEEKQIEKNINIYIIYNRRIVKRPTRLKEKNLTLNDTQALSKRERGNKTNAQHKFAVQKLKAVHLYKNKTPFYSQTVISPQEVKANFNMPM